jgi:hypothetical protein
MFINHKAERSEHFYPFIFLSFTLQSSLDILSLFFHSYFFMPTSGGASGGGMGVSPPLLFDDSFLRFQEKVLLKFSPNFRENPSKIL